MRKWILIGVLLVIVLFISTVGGKLKLNNSSLVTGALTNISSNK